MPAFATKITLTVSPKSISDFHKFIKEIKEEVIDKGLDKPLIDGLSELKNTLYFFINEEIRTINKTASSKAIGEHEIDMPKSHAELIKFLTGVDLDNFNKTKDYTIQIESSILLVKDFRVRLRLPISPYETFEENHSRALNFFNRAMFVFIDSKGLPQYYINPGMTLNSHVKVVCSRDAGNTPKSRKKFESYKNSNKMTRQDSDDNGRFAEWSLKQQGVETIQKKFINLNNIIDDIQIGDYESAISQLSRIASSNKSIGDFNITINNFKDKVQDLKDKKNLSIETEAYTNIISLIRNLQLRKLKTSKGTTYELVSDYDDSKEDSKHKSFFDEVKEHIDTWIIINENLWFNEFVQKAKKVIDKYGS